MEAETLREEYESADLRRLMGNQELFDARRARVAAGKEVLAAQALVASLKQQLELGAAGAGAAQTAEAALEQTKKAESRLRDELLHSEAEWDLKVKAQAAAAENKASAVLSADCGRRNHA